MERKSLFLCTSALLLLLLATRTNAVFEGCDNTYTLNPGVSYVQSPYYPNKYPASTSCRYKFVAPFDYYIEVKCDLNMFSSNGGCSGENFYLDRDGDTQMRGSENFCGAGSFTRNSAFRSLVLGYISTSSNTGTFRCSLTVKPQNCDCGWAVNSRIVNGQRASINEYPSMAALKDQTSNLRSFCGATIIHRNYLLTAAHCKAAVSADTNCIVIVGTNDLASPTSSKFYATYGIQRIIIHEQYRGEPNTVNDIAVVITSTPMEWSRGVGPICLPPAGTSDAFSYVNADVCGWGTTFFAGPTSTALLKAQLMIVENSQCAQQFQGINAAHICTYDSSGNRRDSCQYDSGGPVILRQSRQYIIGIISYGKDCGNGQYPMGVNTRVSSYISWIESKIGTSYCRVSTIAK